MILLIMVLMNSCSTKRNTWSRRAYHNVTCRYNVYWNGMNSLNEGAKGLHQDVKDNYNEILRVYNYGSKQDAQRVYPKMDRTIKKASIGIQKHSMYFGGEERINYVRYSYLMMGKAHFYKQDYISARRVFDYVAKEYEEHPIHTEAYLWLAKTYIETERFEKAEATLNLLQSKAENSYIPLQVRKDLAMVYADFYIATGNYDDAYYFLERGLELGNKRDVVTRAEFILGQINQLDGDLQKATDYYKSVIKRNPDYIMAFEARMNMAQCYDEGTGDSKNINKTLQKMVKDFRNKEFLDQIYFALADVALKDGNPDLAIEYLKKSVSSSVQDNYQKSKSSLQLAEMYFERAQYNDAQAYYDTAVTFLPVDYPDYELIKNKATVLADIVVHAETIFLQDSLQRLARMDTIELYALIDNIIADYIAEKERREEERALAMDQGVMFMDNAPNQAAQRPGGKWYFYNSQAMSMGRTEFINKWGNRKLEDNWRLSDKRGILGAGEEEVALEQGGAANDTTALADSQPSDPESREYYLAGIPFSEDEFLASRELEIDAYHQLGFLYLEELNDTLNAEATYLEFQKKYPDNKYRVESWYALYKIYSERGDAEKSAYYRNLIVSNFPESDYAKVIMDPDFYIKKSEQKGQAARLYERTFDSYNREQYYRVISYADRALNEYPDDTALIPRFLYLRAVSLGKVDVPDTMYNALNDLLRRYPSSPVIPRVNVLLNLLQSEYGIGEPLVSVADTTLTEDISLYNYDPNALHLVIVIINNTDIELNPLKVRISDFKQKYFRLVRLNIKSLMLDNQRSLITIGNFEGESAAYDFYTALINDNYVTSGMAVQEYEIYPITVNNYPILYREKNVKAYQAFFDRYYKKDN
ncbi:MAG: tetratricopeptide repeat protein [bacterium]|jgi:tetratricopeptide (TPR) repeat protein